LEDAADPLPWLVLGILKPFSLDIALGLLFMLLLLLCSALISGSEIAFFALSPQDQKDLDASKKKKATLILHLLKRPKTLLATILIGNNFVNVAIIVLSTYIVRGMFHLEGNQVAAFWVQVVGVTFLILLLGEILPKVFANKNPLKLAALMAQPLLVMQRLFSPLSRVLVWTLSLYGNQDGKKGDNISVDELSHALELTQDDDQSEDEKKILEGIVKFGSTDVKQIMTSRMDIVGFDIEASFSDLIEGIKESGFSRLPVYEENADQIEGIIYIKDLLPHLDESNDFQWNGLIRKPYFVPENKKIDDLLKEFQEKKIHLAVVVDEYGGSSGIVTLEDVIEEIVGDISDEFDDDQLAYSKLDDFNYVFEGKTPLNDLYRVLDIDGTLLEESKGEADTLAGFILEQAGKIPKKNEKIPFERFVFTVEAADRRRIKRVKVTIKDESVEKEGNKN